MAGTTSDWTEDGFANNGATGSAKLNIYGTTRDEWMFTPAVDLGSGGNNALEFDLALTLCDGTGSATLGSDDIFAVVISQSGQIISPTSVLRLWDDSTPISNLGDHIVIDLSAYTGQAQFGFYGFSDTSNKDNDLFVDNVYVGPTAPKLSGSEKTADEDYANWLITYTIAIENPGNMDALGAYLTDTNTGLAPGSALTTTGVVTEGIAAAKALAATAVDVLLRPSLFAAIKGV